MTSKPRRRTARPAPLSAEAVRAVERRGLRRHGLRDLYYDLMTMPLAGLLATLLGYFLTLNIIFALIYWRIGGLGGGNGSFAQDFFYSVQTLSTTGYGVVYPQSGAANVVTSAEIMLGQLNVALSTGVLFARLSRPRPRVLFSQVAVIRRVKGESVLMFRVANERSSEIIEARMSVMLVADEDDGEGGMTRRLHPLKLERESTPIFALSWQVVHRITPDSPLYGKTHEALGKNGNVLVCSLTGTDDVLNAIVTARHVYGGHDLRFGHRFVDVITRGEAGDLVLDYARFHDTEARDNDIKSDAYNEISGNND